jgi:hypothetical protein
MARRRLPDPLSCFEAMRSFSRMLLVSSGSVVIAGGLLFAVGVLSKPRDFSSPSTRIQVIDERGAPISGLEVGRSWEDCDCSKEGSEIVKTDQTGTAQFSRVPANVGLFTGALRKALTSLGSCGSGNGTWTTIYVRYAGRYDVVPKDKPLHPTGQTYQDPDGVTFYVSTDSLSNTLANLSFPKKTKVIDYVLSSRHGNQ